VSNWLTELRFSAYLIICLTCTCDSSVHHCLTCAWFSPVHMSHLRMWLTRAHLTCACDSCVHHCLTCAHVSPVHVTHVCIVVSPVQRQVAAAGLDVMKAETWGTSWCRTVATLRECSRRSSWHGWFHVTTTNTDDAMTQCRASSALQSASSHRQSDNSEYFTVNTVITHMKLIAVDDVLYTQWQPPSLTQHITD